MRKDRKADDEEAKQKREHKKVKKEEKKASSKKTASDVPTLKGAEAVQLPAPSMKRKISEVEPEGEKKSVRKVTRRAEDIKEGVSFAPIVGLEPEKRRRVVNRKKRLEKALEMVEKNEGRKEERKFKLGKVSKKGEGEQKEQKEPANL